MSTQVPPSRLDSTKDFSSLVPAAFTQANSSFDAANSASLYANGAFLTSNDPSAATPNFGGSYGGGGQAGKGGSGFTIYGGSGGNGAVRIMWAGTRPGDVSRAYPSTNTGNL